MSEPGRVLVVDDDPGIRHLLTESVRGAGWQADEAGGGREAIDAVRSTDYAVVILDLRMPPPDGWAVLADLADVVAAGRTAFVACTGFTDDATAERLRTAGVRAIVPKPCPVAQLREVLDEVTGA